MTQLDISFKKAPFSSLLRGPATKWYKGFNTGNPLPTWIQVRTDFITRFSDDRDNYRHRISAENCVRGKEALVKDFYHRVKQAVVVCDIWQIKRKKLTAITQKEINSKLVTCSFIFCDLRSFIIVIFSLSSEI